jgi:hypothetical protein
MTARRSDLAAWRCERRASKCDMLIEGFFFLFSFIAWNGVFAFGFRFDTLRIYGFSGLKQQHLVFFSCISFFAPTWEIHIHSQGLQTHIYTGIELNSFHKRPPLPRGFREPRQSTNTPPFLRLPYLCDDRGPSSPPVKFSVQCSRRLQDWGVKPR